MKIILAPDSFKGSLTSMEAAERIEAAAKRIFPGCETVRFPIADGGEGTVEALVNATGGELRTVRVTGSMGDAVTASYGVIHGDTAVIEMAQANGLTLTPQKERDLLRAGSRGTGEMIRDFRDYALENDISELMLYILDVTGYKNELEMEGTDEARSRLEDIDELINDIVYFEENNEDPTLTDFLVEKDMYTLNAGIDNLEESSNKVLLMTLHNAKGLEFANVFLGGMEEGVFPGYGAMISGDESEIEEERRLCYVGITRAKERLYLSAARRRMQRGQAQYNRVSRFVDEIPEEYLDRAKKTPAEDRRDKAMEQASSHQYAYGTKGVKPYYLDDFKVKPLSSLDYAVGDRVKHIKFGEGTVADIVHGGKDFEVSVDFDRVGRKKMFASFAKLKKVK